MSSGIWVNGKGQGVRLGCMECGLSVSGWAIKCLGCTLYGVRLDAI